MKFSVEEICLSLHKPCFDTFVVCDAGYFRESLEEELCLSLHRPCFDTFMVCDQAILGSPLNKKSVELARTVF